MPLAPGCLSPGYPLTPRQQAIEVAARPILTLDPDAVWTECYNRLVELGPDSIDYLVRQPAIACPTAPDDLSALLHTSLLRLLAAPAGAPPLSANCLETTLDVLHFDLKVNGRSIGTVVLSERIPPHAWHELYPADFDHRLAARIDLEADRRALRAWWLAHRDRYHDLASAHRLRPRPEPLWRLLARREADHWQYQPEPRTVLCAGPQAGPTLLHIPTYDYNLVRAACIWLGSSTEPAVQERLIELVDSPSPVVAHNARFALRYAPDERIRALLRRFETRGPSVGRNR